MASIWSGHVLPSLPLTMLPAEECLPPDLPTLLHLTDCCHWEDWCMSRLSPRHYCHVSMTQDKGTGIYLRPVHMGPTGRAGNAMQGHPVILQKLGLIPAGIINSGSASTLLDLGCFPTGPLKCLHIAPPSTLLLGGFISLGTVPDMSCLSASP